jgi:hypothetical protein
MILSISKENPDFAEIGKDHIQHFFFTWQPHLMTIPSFSRLFEENEIDKVMEVFSSVRSERSSDSAVTKPRKLNKNTHDNYLPTPTSIGQR